MKLLKKENWWIWLLLFIFSDGTSTIALGALLDVFDKNAWYAKWKNWLIGLLLILPITIMIVAFNIEITSKTAAKLEVKGSEYYLSPYIWIILLIIPFVGWIVFVILYLYLTIAILVNLYKGRAEKYIQN
jgi:hypothetical protein